MTTATVVSIDEANARRRQERIRLMASTVREGIDKIGALVDEAKASNDHVALGYASWTAYLADTLGSEPIAIEARMEVIGLLAGHGMSQAAIGLAVGVTQQAVSKSLRSSGHNQVVTSGAPGVTRQQVSRDLVAPDVPPAPDLIAQAADAGLSIAREKHGLPPFDPTTGELLDDVDTTDAIDPAPERTTGLDGKSYPKPTPAKPRRKPLTDSARDAGWELRKAIERLTRIAEDDRFRSNANEVATSLRGHLIYAAEVCQDLLDRLPSTEKEN